MSSERDQRQEQLGKPQLINPLVPLTAYCLQLTAYVVGLRRAEWGGGGVECRARRWVMVVFLRIETDDVLRWDRSQVFNSSSDLATIVSTLRPAADRPGPGEEPD